MIHPIINVRLHSNRGSIRPWRNIAAIGLTIWVAAHPLQAEPRFFIREFRVSGATQFSSLEIEETVYPHLGPGRGVVDVENARASLEKLYRSRGFQTVSVIIPNQDPTSGIVRLEVVEGTIDRLRVTGSRYFLPSRIKQEVPALQPGSLPDFEAVKRQIIALNRLPDRKVTPELTPGANPGTFDVELKVEDRHPLHGSLELNNRYSPNTTDLRLNAALSYGNLFQLGHTLGVNVQVAPERSDDALVYSSYYLARISDRLSLMLQATRQDSDISTLGGAAVAGRGEIIGIRALFDLEQQEHFTHNFSLGVDWKSFDEDLSIGGQVGRTPIEYLPLTAGYGATWMEKDRFTQANLTLTANLRGVGSDSSDFDSKRFRSRGSFVTLRGDLSHTRDLSNGSQIFAKIQGQLSSQPLINTEQFSGGGLSTARGYLEGSALGDHGIFGTLEFRSPSFFPSGDKDIEPDPWGGAPDEWRIHAFIDAGALSIMDPLPAQASSFSFLSTGIGTRFQIDRHHHGSIDLAVPFTNVQGTNSGDIRITFRGWADF